MPPDDAAHVAHEALCRRCGMSCFFAVPVNGLPVVVDELHCKFLTRLPDGAYSCGVYEDRFTQAPWCQTVESALKGGFLAQDCPYTRGIPGYRGKVRLSPRLLQQVLPAIRAEIASAGAPIGADLAGALKLLAGGGGNWQGAPSADGTRYVFTRTDEAEAAPAPVAPAPRHRLPVL